ncbi:DUF4186 family protein [Spirosoma sp. HMF4905]|uniref:DUF4186 family protein n=1 Tax=Spirosoma arboris TaxID=2682092 RepID=A0A7K1SPM6_9BACT|nr:DUF4186 family protein [Spirosoma arboris]MVM35680.1 DUF4186 family protein [Spirosoma arboris]
METLDFGEPLPKVKCTDTKCDEDKHCFRQKRANPKKLEGGKCHACEADLVDWERVHQRDINDVEATFQFMKKEFIRHHFWNIELDKGLVEKNTIKGRDKLEKQVVSRLKSSVKCAGDKNAWDGRQTPIKKKHLIYFAQHATATCCRKCIKYWHGIPYDRELSEEEIEYLKNLIMRYIEDRIPLPKEKKDEKQTSLTFDK